MSLDEETEARLRYLATLDDGWLDGESKAVTDEAFAAARAFLGSLPERMRQYRCGLVPTAEGGLNLEWENGDRWLCVEFGADGRGEWCIIDEAGEYRFTDGVVTDDRPWLAWFLDGTPMPATTRWEVG